MFVRLFRRVFCSSHQIYPYGSIISNLLRLLAPIFWCVCLVPRMPGPLFSLASWVEPTLFLLTLAGLVLHIVVGVWQHVAEWIMQGIILIAASGFVYLYIMPARGTDLLLLVSVLVLAFCALLLIAGIFTFCVDMRDAWKYRASS